jgi:preprotein translocase subunit SecG
MSTVLLLIHVMVAIALVGVILLQRSEGGALGMGGGGMGGLFSPRGAADTLTRTTAILAALFFLTCVGLNLLALHGRSERSILDVPATSQGPAAAPKPKAPVNVPAPSGPQVPKPQ